MQNEKELILFAGVEGGASKTQLSLVDQYGSVIYQSSGGPSNPWMLTNANEDGFTLVATRLNRMIVDALSVLNTAMLTYRIESLACCLSGGGTKIAQERLLKEFEKLNVSYRVFVTNDSFASIFTAFKNGGAVLIAGTGSYALLMNPSDYKLNSIDDIRHHSSGGWGCILGDEGSGFWIATQIVKYLIKVNDGFIRLTTEKSLKEYELLKNILFDHFQIENLRQILEHYYKDRKNDKIAGLTEKLAKIASVDNQYVTVVFHQAGYELANHLLSLLDKLDHNLIDKDTNSLGVVCAGSLFKSWHLLKSGFVECCRRTLSVNCRLFTLKENNSSIGAAYLAARLTSTSPVEQFVIDHAQYTSLLEIISPFE